MQYGYSPSFANSLAPNVLFPAYFHGYSPIYNSGYSPIYNPGYSPMLISNYQNPPQFGYSPMISTGYSPGIQTMNNQSDNMDSPPMIKALVNDDEISDALDAGDPLLACNADISVDFFTSRFSKVTTTATLKVCQEKSYNIIPDISSESVSTITGDAIDIKSRVTGNRVTCIEFNELGDMCAILCEILVHFDPSSGALITNEFGDVEEILSIIVEEEGETLSRLFKNFYIDETEDKIAYRYRTAAGKLGKSFKKKKQQQ